MIKEEILEICEIKNIMEDLGIRKKAGTQTKQIYIKFSKASKKGSAPFQPNFHLLKDFLHLLSNR